MIFQKASKLQFKSLDELASVYSSWAEMHLRHRNYESALTIMQHACTSYRPSQSKKNKQQERTNSLYSNLKAWSFYVDLLENLGTFENTKAAYERMIQIKIATP